MQIDWWLLASGILIALISLVLGVAVATLVVESRVRSGELPLFLKDLGFTLPDRWKK